MIRSEHLQFLGMLVPTLLLVIALSLSIAIRADPASIPTVTGSFGLEETVVVE